MTTIINNYNFNFSVNQFNAPPSSPALGGFSLQLAAGIMGSFMKPLFAGPFASPRLPSAVDVQGCHFQPPRTPGDEPRLTPLPDARWTAELKGRSEASVDLGDGYTLEFDERNSEIRINNANTGETTRIWGDPHVDIDGKHAFNFWGTTTFELENGTKITIDTEQYARNPNEYLASQVTITKGDQAIVVDGISQNALGDLSVSMSNNGRAIDALTRDGFTLEENATGAGWRSELTGGIATQADLDLTKVGQIYGPGSGMPSLGEISEQLSAFLLMGFATSLALSLSGQSQA